MNNDPFAIKDEDLCSFYQLKTLEPQTSWAHDSTFLFQLNKVLDESSVDSSYALLNELLQQEHNSSFRNHTIEVADTPDPLGSNVSLLTLLSQMNIPDNEKYIYFINSKKFNSKLFLKNIHTKDTFDDLSASLDTLDRSLQQQSDQLKQLVQENFVKYVRSKNNLDQIYDQFHNLIVDESNEFGVEKLSKSVNETVRETALKLKPLMDTSNKIKNFQSTIQYVQENKNFFNLPRILKMYLYAKDYTNLMFEYSGAQQLYKNLSSRGDAPSPIIDRIWNEVENIVDKYRKRTWELLITPRPDETQEDFLPLISKLLDLKVEDNPIISWIYTRFDGFENELNNLSSQMLSKIVHTQQNILENGNADDIDMSFYLYMNNFLEEADFTASVDGSNAIAAAAATRHQGLTDSPLIIEMWLLILKYTSSISQQCEKFVEFWEHVEKFLDGTYQTSLLNDKRKDTIIVGEIGDRDNYKMFLELEDYQIKDIGKRGEQFVTHLNTKVSSFFLSSQASLNNGMIVEEETGSPQDYGFIPPRSNSLSCLRYLPKIVDPILKFTTELAQLNISTESIELLRNLDATILNRCTSAVSSTKLRDIRNFYKLENWEIFQTIGKFEYGVTQFPEIVNSFQQFSIKVIRDMLFSFERLPILNNISILSYPSRQLLTGIEVQQIISMEAVLESIIKNAAEDKDNPRTPHTILTLTNLQYIRENTFPRILQFFDESFECHLSEKNLEIFTLLAKMESSIFGNYLSDLKVNLRDILEEKFYEINWATHTSNSFRAGDYIIESLMVLVTVHSECYMIGPQLINKILKEAQFFISKYLFEAFKPYIGNISSEGLLQVTVDLQFFQRVLGNLLEKDTKATLIACLQNCFQNDVPRMQRCIAETEPIVTANLNRTSVQFASFE